LDKQQGQDSWITIFAMTQWKLSHRKQHLLVSQGGCDPVIKLAMPINDADSGVQGNGDYGSLRRNILISKNIEEQSY
jgi:hypothetical protein